MPKVHVLPFGTLNPQRPLLAKRKRTSPAKLRVIFSCAPAHLGMGRPAQSQAGQE